MRFGEAYPVILDEIGRALDAVDETQVEELIGALLGAERVFLTGVGRVLLSVRAFAKRLNHIGIPAWCVGDTDEPAAPPGDLLVVASGSGESVIPLAIARVAKAKGVRVAHVGSNPASSLAPLTDLFVRIPVRTRLGRDDEIASEQPMTSLFEQALLVFFDAVCLAIVRRRQIDLPALWSRHANLE